MSWSYPCHKCGAEPGKPCRNLRTGEPIKNEHAGQRYLTLTGSTIADLTLAAYTDITTPKTKLPPKLKYKRRDRSHVWCDVHCTIHEAETDPYGETYDGQGACGPDDWRRVYVETDDKQETF